MPPNKNPSTGRTAHDVMAATAIYDGLKYLGEVVELRCGQWQAAFAGGEVVGTYPDARAATDAVLVVAGRKGPSQEARLV